jgi:hypothetical protein
LPSSTPAAESPFAKSRRLVAPAARNFSIAGLEAFGEGHRLSP